MKMYRIFLFCQSAFDLFDNLNMENNYNQYQQLYFGRIPSGRAFGYIFYSTKVT